MCIRDSTHTHTHVHARTHTHTYTRAHACTHTHTRALVAHIFPRLLKACSRELKSIGVGDREKVSLQLRFEGRQSLRMSHRHRKIVPDGRTNERKGALCLEPFRYVQNTEDVSVSRGAESV